MPVPTFYLRLDGVEIPVRAPQGGELPLELGGEIGRTWDNAVYSNALAGEQARSWRFTTPSMLWAEWDQYRPLLEDMQPHQADGWAIDQTGAAVEVLAMLEETPNEYDTPTDVRYAATFVLLETLEPAPPPPPGP